MNNSLKIGAVSGLIAGIVHALMMEITNPLSISLGLYETWWRTIILDNLVVNVPMLGFFGMILGIIYSKVYSIIPRKTFWKGLIYGFFLYFIIVVRIETYLLPYGQILNVVGYLVAGFFDYIIFGLILGILYELLSKRYHPVKEDQKIMTYPMMSGLLPGAIAGFCGGISSGFVSVIGTLSGYMGVVYEPGGEIIPTISFWAAQFGTHVLINMIWGTIFGAFFALVYNLVPGEKVRKGLYYGLIMYLITSFQLSIWVMVWFTYRSYWSLVISEIIGLAFASNMIIYGLVLGYLYKKLSE